MRFTILLSFILIFINSSKAQSFQIALGGAQEEFAYSFQQTQDNGYIVAGRTFSFGTGGWECYLTRFNSTGDTLWTKTYGNVLYDEFQDVDTTSDGGFIAVGHTTTTDWDGNVYLIKTNANGIVQWSKEYGGTIGLSDKGYSVRETTDGGFILTGTTETFGSGGDDVYVLKVNSTGAVQWTTTIGSPGTTSVMDAGREVQETNDGGYIVVGYTSAVDINFSDIYLIKLNSSGVVQWKKAYGGGSYDIGYTVQQTTDNGFIIGATTNSYGAGNWDAMLLKTDANGVVQWSKTYGKSGEDRAQCARQTSDGGYIMCGRSSSFGAGNFDVVLYRSDSNGNLMWTKAYGGSGDDQGFYVRPIGTGFVFCGYTVSFGAGIKDLFFGRTDANGSIGCNEITGTGFTTSSPSVTTSVIGNTSNGGSVINPSTATRNTLSVKNILCASSACSVNAGIDQTVCAGTSVTLNATGASSYSWSNAVQNGVAFVPTQTQTYSVTGTTGGCSATDQVTVTVLSAPQVNAGVDQTVCSGASVTLNATGASSYSWSNAVQNGVAFIPTQTQTYSVTGTTGGCATTDQVTVTVAIAPQVNAGIDQTVCAGTSVTLNATGASSYSWSNAIQNGVAFVPTQTQTYSVTGTTGGCATTDQVTVTVAIAPQVNAGIDQTVCAGTSVTLNATGASSYSWSNAIQNGVAFVPTQTQTYTVTGTTGGCATTDQVTVTINPLPTIVAGQDVTVCEGQSVLLNATGSNNLTWSNGTLNGFTYTPLSSEVLVVTGINNNGCQNSDTMNVIVNLNSSATINESAIDNYTLNGQTYTQSGTYTQIIQNTNGCDSTITLNLQLSFTNLNEGLLNELKVYPNPSAGLLFFENAYMNYSEIKMLDPMGRIVLSCNLKSNLNSIDVSILETGIYFLYFDGFKYDSPIVIGN